MTELTTLRIYKKQDKPVSIQHFQAFSKQLHTLFHDIESLKSVSQVVGLRFEFSKPELSNEHQELYAAFEKFINKD